MQKNTLTKNEQVRFSRMFSEPVRFSCGVLGHDPWSMQRKIMRAIANHKKVAVKACHASSKTFTAADIVLWWTCYYRKGIVITTAPTWTQVEKILWKEIHTAAKRDSRVKFPPLNKTEIPIDKDNYAIGISTNEGVRFQGWHGQVLIVLDEAPGIQSDIWDSLEGMRAGGDVRILALGNPTIIGGPFYDVFRRNLKGWTPFTISAFDTPNLRGLTLEDVLSHDQEDPWHDDNVRPYLTTRRWVWEMYHEWGLDDPRWESRVMGEFPKSETNAIIPLGWVEQCLSRDFSKAWKREPYVVACDVARFGADKTAFSMVKGGFVFPIETYSKQSTQETAGRLIRLLKECEEKGIRITAPFRVDDTGVGGGVTDRLDEEGHDVIPMNFGSSAFDPDTYVDLRTEMWWNMREMFSRKELAIPDDPELIAQLTTPTYSLTGSGKIRLESKDSLKKRGVVSPDRADALGMAVYPQDWISNVGVRVV